MVRLSFLFWWYKYRVGSGLKTKKALRLTWALNSDNHRLTLPPHCGIQAIRMRCLPVRVFSPHVSRRALLLVPGCSSANYKSDLHLQEWNALFYRFSTIWRICRRLRQMQTALLPGMENHCSSFGVVSCGFINGDTMIVNTFRIFLSIIVFIGIVIVYHNNLWKIPLQATINDFFMLW